MQVIGSGFGRSGTKSTKDALEMLGFAPCHHMYEVVDHPDQVAHWQAVFAGQAVQWHAVFAGYRAQVDWPGAHVWRELAQAYPEAKVLHTVRPEDSWCASFATTIGKLSHTYKDMELPPHIAAMMEATMGALTEQTFDGDMTDPDKLRRAYRQRTEQVRDTIEAERLLVFDVAEGWEPLCRFLGVPVPAGPFPHMNHRADFWQALGGEPD